MDFLYSTIRRNNILRVFKLRSFSALMLSEFFSQIAFNMQHFVLIFLIYELTHSNTAVSGVILSFTVPAIFFSFITGIYVDRWNKKRVLFITNLLRGLFLIPFFFSDLHISLIYAFTFLIAIATQFFLPAEASVIPSIVRREILLSANAVFSLGIYVTTLLGYILAGPVVLLFGKTESFVLLSALYFISALLILFVRIPKRKKNENIRRYGVPSLASEASEIFLFIRKTKKVMYALSMLTIAQAVIFMFAVLAPGYASTVLKIQLESLSWILIAPAAVGMGLGAFMMGSFGKKFNRKWLSSLGFMITGVSFVIFPLGQNVIQSGFLERFNIDILHFIVLMAIIIGFAISLVFAPSNTTIQMETDESMRGRIYGLLNALIGAVSFLPVILAGGLADLLGTVTVIIGFGIAMFFLGIFFWTFD